MFKLSFLSENGIKQKSRYFVIETSLDKINFIQLNYQLLQMLYLLFQFKGAQHKFRDEL